MRTKGIIFILCLLLVLLSMAGVSAADIDDMAIQTSDAALDSVIESDGSNMHAIGASSDENNILDASFNDLQSLIDDASEGAEIDLKHDYSIADDGKPIIISKSITIDGNNHTLDGSNKNLILYMDGKGKNVVFKNIVFVRGNASENGGAILNKYSSTSLTLINCQFNDNFANDNGGAVFSYGNLNINNSQFNSNVAQIDGGAIYCKGETTVCLSEFKDNSANGEALPRSFGGAIRSEGKCSIDSCTFDSNDAYNRGGAIYADNDLVITGKNKFMHNSAGHVSEHRNGYGGAIYCCGNANIDYAGFNGNWVYVDGGAIYCEGKTTISNSYFKGNSATTYQIERCFGGAIRSNGLLTVTDCTFEKNTAYNRGGAIYAGDDLVISGQNKFNNNNVGWTDGYYKTGGLGGAIFCCGDANIDNAIFSGNDAQTDGGAIYCEGKTTISNSQFNDNSATSIYKGERNFGGAIRSNGLITVTNCDFENNHADNWAGAIYADGEIRINNCSFIGNNAEYYGAIYTSTIGQTVSDSTFNKNTATKGDGGAIYVNNKCDLEFVSCTFEENSCLDRGGAIYPDSSGSTIKLYGCTFVNNKVENQGGAVYVDNDIVIKNCTFIGNSAKNYGAVYACTISQTVSDSTFNKNTATDDNGGAIYIKNKCDLEFVSCTFEENSCPGIGGAIYPDSSRSTLKLSHCIFLKNKAGKQGGAAYIDNDIVITNCTFIGNSANYAGAVYACTISQTVYDSTFNKNNASSGDGGAIYINNKCDLEFISCSFEENTCHGDGGAIYIDSSRSPLRLSNCTFVGNKADVDGGAVYSPGDTTISDSDFRDNNATGKTAKRSWGGAVRSNGLTIVNNCNFGNNYADNWGGAIYAHGEIRITDSNFTDNSAKNYGGAVYTSTIDETVSKSIFLRNSVTSGDGGAIYINNKCTPEFVSCMFEGNTCKNRGGALYLDSSHSHLKLSFCTLVDNTAGSKGQTIYNSGYYDLFDMCWFGTNNPKFKDQFKIWHSLKADEDYKPTNYLKIAMKVNETDLYLNNTYELTVYFYSTNGNSLYKDLLHGPGFFSGDGNFSNVKADINDMTADVVFVKKYNVTEGYMIWGQIDDQAVSLNLDVRGKVQSEVNILSCENITYPDALEVTYVISSDAPNPTYVIMDSEGNIVKEGNCTNSLLKHDYITVENLYPGDYSITIYSPESRTYLPSNATASFKVNKKQSEVKIISCENITYPDALEVTYTISYGVFYPTYSIKNADGEIVREGKCNYVPAQLYEILTVENLDPGDYSITIINPESQTSLPSNASADFKVIRKVSANLTADNVSYGNPTTITLKSDYDGLYNVSINDLVLEMEVVNGICTKQVKFNAGEYQTKTTCSDDVLLNCSEASFAVEKAINNVVVDVENVSYGTPSIIRISADADGDYIVDVNGTSFNVTVKDGVGNISVVLDAGGYYANANFDDENYNTTYKNTVFTVNKADIDLVVVVFDEVYPQDVEGIVYASVDGDYNLTVAGHSTIVSVKDSLAYVNLGTLDADTYEATVSFAGNDNYNPASNSTTFNVYREGTVFEIDVDPSVFSYGETENVTHILPDGATGSITYYLDNGTFLGMLDVGENLALPILDAGSYAIIANYSGDHDFKPAMDTILITVNPARNNAVVSVDNVTYGDESLIEVSADIDGTYLVDINGTSYDVTVNDGAGNRSVVLDAGVYYANVTFDNRNYDTSSDNAIFEVYKADTNLILEAHDAVYPQELKVIVHSNVDGDYNLTVDGHSTVVAVKDGIAEFNVGVLDAGSYVISADYSGDRNFKPAQDTVSITVSPAQNNAVISVANVTYGKDALAVVAAEADGDYQVDVNGTVYNVTVVDGFAEFFIDVLDAGVYYANLTFDNRNYNTTSQNTDFEVFKADIYLIAIAFDTVYPQDVMGVIYSSLDGEYNLTVGEYSTIVVVEDCLAEFDVGGLNAGVYPVVISYPGDLNHNPISSSRNVTIDKYAPNIALNVSDIDYGDVAVISITSDVPGSVNVTVNGITETLELNGQILSRLFSNALGADYGAALSLSNLNAGSYPVTVTYNGDENFRTVTKSGEFNVNSINATMDIEASDISVGEEEAITVTLPSDATGNVTVTIDGKDYTAPVIDGKAVFDIPGLAFGDKVAYVYYSGDDNYDSAVGNVSFVVDRFVVDMSVESNEPLSGEKIHIVVTLPEDATGTVTVTINGKDYTVDVKDGKAVFDIPGLAAGKYDIVVYYSGDDKYDSCQIDYIITVKENGKKHNNQSDIVSPSMAVKAGNPIFVLLLALMTIGSATIRRSKK